MAGGFAARVSQRGAGIGEEAVEGVSQGAPA